MWCVGVVRYCGVVLMVTSCNIDFYSFVLICYYFVWFGTGVGLVVLCCGVKMFSGLGFGVGLAYVGGGDYLLVEFPV